jgi:hypothetical protein
MAAAIVLAVRIKILLSLTLVAAFLLGSIASAHVQTANDPDDWADKLDIKTIALDHSGTRLKLSVRTYEDWATRTLGDGKHIIYFQLDTKNGNAADFGVNITRDPQKGLVCLVTKEPEGSLVTNGDPNRRAPNQAQCDFKRSDVSASGSKTIHWRASIYNLQTYEHDQAPDTGWLSHHI